MESNSNCENMIRIMLMKICYSISRIMETRTAAVIRKEIEDLENLMKGERSSKNIIYWKKIPYFKCSKKDMIFLLST